MNNGRFTYEIPEEILRDAGDEFERRELRDAWNVLENVPALGTDSRKMTVKAAVMGTVHRSSDRDAIPLARHPNIFSLHRFQLVAAAIVLLIGISFLLMPGLNTVESPAGSSLPTLVHLDDGSVVHLSPGSSLTTTESFGLKSRNVTLNGKAYFDVAHNEEIPFQVRTFNSTTTVLGTEFSVQAWSGDLEARTRVVVASGRVSFESGNEQTLLTAGQMSASMAGEESVTDPQSVETSRELAWLEGGFAYSNEPVGNVLRDLERRYETRLQAPASIRLRPISYWKNVAPENPAEVLADISTTIGVRYRATANGYEMYLP